MKRIFAATLQAVFIGADAFFAVGSMAMMSAMHQCLERASCYQSGAGLESCGEPSFIERKMAHYIAHVDL
jgi:hypothetical protein